MSTDGNGRHLPEHIALLFRLGIGPWLTPLRGKIPIIDAWTSQPAATEAMVRDWLGAGHNVGLRTGSCSGIVVIDDDQARNDVPETDRYQLPPTGLVAITPTGGRHGFYLCPVPAPRNSASRLAPYVDVRGEGGQVVVPPSIHPVAHEPYRWESTGSLGEFPVVESRQVDAITLDMRVVPQAAAGLNAYAETALLREVARVRLATEGTRNATLNAASFSTGQLCGSGLLDPTRVAAEMTAAALISGLGEKEIVATVKSGMAAGMAKPRTKPDRPVTPSPSLASAEQATVTFEPQPINTSNDKATVYVPGAHPRPDGSVLEQSSDRFAKDILCGIDSATIYRRSTAIGEIHKGQFVPVTPNRLRSIIDESIRLIFTKLIDDGNGGTRIVQIFRACTLDNAAIMLHFASVRGNVRTLKHIARYPVCVGPEFETARPGWNESSGVYLDCAEVPDPLPMPEARAVLEDLICDFPFASPADRANYFGLLLTVILRPAIGEPVPMHMIGASVMGSGKSKLAEIVLGCGVLGRPLPATQIGVREEEREKRITAAMISGDAVIHLDNIKDFIDSAALASLLTCSVYRGRELGLSRMLELQNDATLIATGNNIHTTDEIARRIVPIMLQPTSESPELRHDYRHPHLRQYVEGNIQRNRAALLGLIAAWRAAGRPLGEHILGSFERWSAVVGGIMQIAGYPEWLANVSLWRGTSDDFTAELRAFVRIWHAAYGEMWIDLKDLFQLAERNGLFSRQIIGLVERGQLATFHQRVMAASQNRVVGKFRIELDGQGSGRRARLAPIGG